MCRHERPDKVIETSGDPLWRVLCLQQRFSVRCSWPSAARTGTRTRSPGTGGLLAAALEPKAPPASERPGLAMSTHD
eukprot:3013532-Heterocapsa_arctica.AAC.1